MQKKNIKLIIDKYEESNQNLSSNNFFYVHLMAVMIEHFGQSFQFFICLGRELSLRKRLVPLKKYEYWHRYKTNIYISKL